MPQRPLQVLERTFAVLALFTRDRSEWTTTEIARACDLPITTAYRILTALHRHRYVARDDFTRRYSLGPAAVELGERARAGLDLRRVVLPVLRRLALETDETAVLTVLNDERNRSVCLERVESSQPLRLSVEPGRQLPLHAGASQKALLAFMTEEETDEILSEPLEKLCRGTVTDPEALRADVAEIRRRGWAISFEENDVGAWGVAAPILDAEGRVLGSIGLAGPSARLSRREVVDHVWRLQIAVTEVARTLGLPAPTLESVVGGKSRSRVKEVAWR